MQRRSEVDLLKIDLLLGTMLSEPRSQGASEMSHLFYFLSISIAVLFPEVHAFVQGIAASVFLSLLQSSTSLGC